MLNFHYLDNLVGVNLSEVWIPFYSGYFYHLLPTRIFLHKRIKQIWIVISVSGEDSGNYYNSSAYMGPLLKSNIDVGGTDSTETIGKETRLTFVGLKNDCYEYRLENLSSSSDNYLTIFCMF